MQTSRLRIALLGALLCPAMLGAQAVGGVGPDARVLPGGALSIALGNEWGRFFERYGRGSPLRRDGTLEPLGVDLSRDTVGAAQLEHLGLVESGVRSLAGMPDFRASLGKAIVRVRDQVLTMPLAIDLGLTSRLSVGAVVPLVTARAEVDFRMNPTGREPTVGFNPTLATAGAIAANAVLLSQFDSAASQLGARLAFCAANAAATGCASLNANAVTARALIQDAGGFATALGQLYGGRGGSRGALFVPIAGTAAQSAIMARVGAYRALYASFGNASISSTGPVASQAPLTAADMQHVLADTAFGVRARPLASSVTRGVGDIDLVLKLKLFDSFGRDIRKSFTPSGFNLRQSLGGVYRLGTGQLDSPDDFTDLGTGQHQNDVEVRSFTDLLFGSHFWLSIVARYNMQMADERVMRILDTPDQPLAPAWREHTVKRDLGDELNVSIGPQWTLNDFVALAGHYSYRRKFADSYTGRFTVPNLAGQPVTIDAATLNMETEAREHRFGGGITYSTVASHERGNATFPLEVSYFHLETTRGSGGSVPKMFVDQLSVRVYGRIFGR